MRAGRSVVCALFGQDITPEGLILLLCYLDIYIRAKSISSLAVGISLSFRSPTVIFHLVAVERKARDGITSEDGTAAQCQSNASKSAIDGTKET